MEWGFRQRKSVREVVRKRKKHEKERSQSTQKVGEKERDVGIKIGWELTQQKEQHWEI